MGRQYIKGRDYSLFSFQGSTLYYDNQLASPADKKAYYRKFGARFTRTVKEKPTLPKKYAKLFNKSSLYVEGKKGVLNDWTKPMLQRGGANPEFGWRKMSAGNTKAPGKYGARLDKDLKGSGASGILKGAEGWARHIQIAITQLEIQAEHFRVLAGERAMMVFQKSFEKKRFYSSNSSPWQKLSAATLKKREKRKTGSRILWEYGDLGRSIKMDYDTKGLKIYTDKVGFDRDKHKYHTNCYAGWHNEGEGTYGRTGKKYIKRQFMGHSSYLDPMTDKFMRNMRKVYLFDNVFVVRK